MESAVLKEQDPLLKDLYKIDLDSFPIEVILEKLFLSPNASIEVINRAIAYKETLLSRQAKASFDRALVVCQSEIPRINKNKTATVNTKTGGTYSYNYASMDEISEVVKPILAKHGLAFTCDVFPHKDRAGTTVIVGKLRHVGGHEETTEFEAATTSFNNSNNAQALASLETFARRYVFCRMLNITPSDDNDAIGEGDNKGYKITYKWTPESGNGALPTSAGASNGQGFRPARNGQPPSRTGSIGHHNEGQSTLAPNRKEDEKRFRAFTGTIQMAVKKKDVLLLQTAVPIGASILSEDLKRKARSMYDKAQEAVIRTA